MIAGSLSEALKRPIEGRLADIWFGRSGLGWAKEQAYRQTWADIAGADLESLLRQYPPTFIPAINYTNCTHRGAQLRTQACSTCKGNVSVKVFGCTLHGECSLAPLEGVRHCDGCPTYKPPASDLIQIQVARQQRTAINWAVGVTTAPRTPSTLEPCLQSIRAAGWEEFRLFVDGEVPIPTQHPITRHVPAVGAFSNWWLALGELYHRNPTADVYVLFQDDCIVAPHSREYLEQIAWPTDAGVLSIYTAARREDRQSPGFHPVKPGKGGMGAVAYLFTHARAKQVLTNEFVLNHRRQQNGTKAIDGTIATWCRRERLKEYVHTPSLVQHIGDVSTLGHAGARGQRRSSSFIGERTDARELLKDPPIPATRRQQERIGLIGYNTASGLGSINRDLAKHLNVARWIVKQHSRYETLPLPPGAVLHQGTDLRPLLQGLDAIVFAETPYDNRLLPMCRELDIRTVCIPMAEWFPAGGKGWPQLVDQFIFPTLDCEQQLRPLVANSEHIPWPIDTEAFPFRLRERAEAFVFVHGTGGVSDRKGGQIVAAAASLVPEIPLIVYSQAEHSRRSRSVNYQPINWPKHVEIRPHVANPSELYRDGDVCVQPSRVEGLGLPLLECQASGMPLITTDGPPMNEYQPLRVVAVDEGRTKNNRFVATFNARVGQLAQAMREVHQTDIAEYSAAARAFVEREHSWAARAEQIQQLILGPRKVKA